MDKWTLPTLEQGIWGWEEGDEFKTVEELRRALEASRLEVRQLKQLFQFVDDTGKVWTVEGLPDPNDDLPGPYDSEEPPAPASRTVPPASAPPPTESGG